MEDEVVISGVGGHFPECDNLKEYQEKLLQNLHLISDVAGEPQPSECLHRKAMTQALGPQAG